MSLALLVLSSYLLGAIPFGMLVARSQGVDIFKAGSGNPGATNVWRATSPGWGLLVFFLDIVKGVIPAVAARWVTDEQWIWFAVGLVAVVGHSFSPFVGFRGGKGVSTALGATIGSAPLVAGAAFGVFAVFLAATRFVSLSSTAAAISTLLFVWIIPRQSPRLLPLFGVLLVLVVWRHRANYKRLLKGEEPKFNFRSKKKDPDKDE